MECGLSKISQRNRKNAIKVLTNKKKLVIIVSVVEIFTWRDV